MDWIEDVPRLSNTESTSWMFPPPTTDAVCQTQSHCGWSTNFQPENIIPPLSCGLAFGNNELPVPHQHEVFPQGDFGGFVPNNIPAADSERGEHAHYGELGGIGMNGRQQYDPAPSSTRSEPRRTGRKRIWTKPETSFLVECKRSAFHDKGSPYRKQKPNATNWEAISTAMRENDPTWRSDVTGDQCRRRWDTLVKSHRVSKKYCAGTRKSYAELTKEETRELRLATTLEKTWYEVIDTMSSEARVPKSDNLPRSVDACAESSQENGQLLESSYVTTTDPLRLLVPGAPPMIIQNLPSTYALQQVSTESLWPRKSDASSKQIAIPGFSSLDRDLRSTLLDLLLGCRFLEFCCIHESLSVLCSWLSIIQNRRCSDVYDEVNRLVKMKLVHLSEDKGLLRIDESRLRVFDKFVTKMIRKNPVFDTHKYLRCPGDTKFISAMQSALPLQTRVLSLVRCEGLVRVELSGLPRLRSLRICQCWALEEVTGWECLRELGWLQLKRNWSYADYPDFRNLPSLREVRFDRHNLAGCPAGLKFNVSQCVRLRGLEIWGDDYLKESGDLSSLKCLEELSFNCCSALSKVSGFSGLQSLTRLDLLGCGALRSLPDLGYTKELVFVDISWTGVEEIPGVEKLERLRQLCCVGSELKVLPDLRHLPELRRVVLADTPLADDDTSSLHFGKREVRLNCEETELVEVGDISDTESTLME